MKHDSQRTKSMLAPLQTTTTEPDADKKIATTPLPIIPTGIEAILSPRSTSTCGRNGLAVDELYDERRSLRREWIRFMDSMDSSDEENKSDTSAFNDRYQPKSPSGKSETLDVEFAIPPRQTPTQCHLDSLFSEEYDEVMDENRDEYEYENNDDDVFHTFRSLKEQVDRLDGILEEFSDLPNSPSSNASSPMSKSKSHALPKKSSNRKANPLQGGLYNECDTFEDEWEALDKLETDLRQELKSASAELESKSYCEDTDKAKTISEHLSSNNTRHSSQNSQVCKEKYSTENKRPIAVVTIDTRSTEPPSTSAMIMDCVVNTSCTPRACSDVLEEDREDWDAIAVHRSNFDPSTISQSQSLLSNRKKVLSPISESSLDENNFTSPLSSQSNFPTETNDILSTEGSVEESQRTKMIEELHESRKKKMSTRPSPVSYTINVKPFKPKNDKEEQDISNSTTTKVKESPAKSSVQSHGHNTVSYTIMVPRFSSPETSGSPIRTQECSQVDNPMATSDESSTKSVEDNSESKNNESEFESNIVILPSRSASTLTRDEAPSSGSMNSHDAKLNEILLEDENSLKNTTASEHQILQEILSEHDDSNSENDCVEDKSLLKIEMSQNQIPSVYAAKSPATHLRSVEMNNLETPQSIQKKSEKESQHSDEEKSTLSDNTETPFFSANLSFELDAISAASLDLMTISVDEASLAKDAHPKSETKDIIPEQALTESTEMTTLDIMNTESGKGYVSPLTSPIASDDTGIRRERSIDYAIGELYAQATVGDVIVLDEEMQDSLAKMKESRNQFSSSNPVNDRLQAHNGIETILAEEKMTEASDKNEDCNYSNWSLSNISNGESSISDPCPSNDVRIVTGENNIELVTVERNATDKKKEANIDKEVQIVPGDDDIEIIQLDVSKINDGDSIDVSNSDDDSLDVSNNNEENEVLHRHDKSEDDFPANESMFAQENVDIDILSINKNLIQAILSQNFAMYSDLIDDEISGIDVQGQVVNGRQSQWEAELRLRNASEEDNDEDAFQTLDVSMEDSSINKLSPDVALLVYTLLESKNNKLVNVFRETRIWKKTSDERKWKNYHVHRSMVNDPWKK
eukprot:CAMPEP_0116152442 /NCGR_PEP_ID=MMETSP0329-20121206/20650_1 /TAXON_ID=697910 /ORGANISM="Pseudo-nitzschia arenysensis, Strain B593" /LENGTH=1093 /DNA_ID=CAMNT_0003649157 /DNA_START=73 /DNA_END=3355 /DNA_ORIENTATION=+